jgi:hypothetical protein
VNLITRLALVRLLPVLFVAVGGVFYVFHVEGAGAYAVRNAVPILVLPILAAITLYNGGGRWSGEGLRWSLGTLGYAIPAFGLAMYLHYGYATDLDGMFSESLYPVELFRFLPLYTSFAGGIGFTIGWIAGKNA